MCKVTSFWFLFNFSSLTHIPYLELIYFWKLLAPQEKTNNIALFVEELLHYNFKVELLCGGASVCSNFKLKRFMNPVYWLSIPTKAKLHLKKPFILKTLGARQIKQ